MKKTGEKKKENKKKTTQHLFKVTALHLSLLSVFLCKKKKTNKTKQTNKQKKKKKMSEPQQEVNTSMIDIVASPGHSSSIGASSCGSRLNPLLRRLKTEEIDVVTSAMELLQGIGVKKEETLEDMIDVLGRGHRGDTLEHQTSQEIDPPDYNKCLEEAVQCHFQSWVDNVRTKTSRAICWVMQSMLEDAKKGKTELAYDIPPGQDDFLHEAFPSWLEEDRGIAILKSIIIEELSSKGFTVSRDSLERLTHGDDNDRYYFKLNHCISPPAETLGYSSPPPPRTPVKPFSSKRLVS